MIRSPSPKAIPVALVIGAGPAGLMAAERLAAAGLAVTVADAMPSAGRKLLMAGKSGLNLTKVEPPAAFLAAYGDPTGRLAPLIAEFDGAALQRWARDLGQQVFTGSTGQVFPRAMKASPLLRAWLARLGQSGVGLRTRWRWTGFGDGQCLRFDTAEGPRTLQPDVCVLALGGASWSRLGSDGAWAPWLADRDVELAPFQPVNVGLRMSWPPQMARHFGQPVKGTALSAGDATTRGEYVISARGLEGGGIYRIGRALREGSALTVDLLPDLAPDDVARKLAAGPGKASTTEWLRRALRLDPARLALLTALAHPLPRDGRIATLVKALPIPHDGAYAMDEAISTAGGIAWSAVDDSLMIRRLPGIFAAGEMLDWEAPTGGYLLTACFATGYAAGEAAARYVRANP